MSNLVQFVPKAHLDAKSNLQDFIDLARDKLTAFTEDGGQWSDNSWKKGKTVARFSTNLLPFTSYDYSPMVSPFIEFAKAYVKYTYSLKPVTNLQMQMQAIRVMEEALIEATGKADISLLNGAIMDVAATVAKRRYPNPETLHKTGGQLKLLADFCRQMMLTPSLGQWSSPFPKPTIKTEDIGEEGKQHREEKLPDNEVMLMLSELFANAVDPEDRYFTSILILLMVAPSRISEVFSLSTDCLIKELDDTGDERLAIRWRAAKGKGVMKKWVPKVMESVVQEAVNRLIDIGEPARKCAKFAFENPKVFMRHEGCITAEDFPDSKPLTPEDFLAAIGGKMNRPQWNQMTPKWIKNLLAKGPITYKALGEHFFNEYSGKNWPYVDSDKYLRTWNALCLYRENEFHADFSLKRFSWVMPTQNTVNNRFSKTEGGGAAKTLWEKHSLTNQDGSPIDLLSHQPRHWLSTMSERAGMDDLALANWAGRALARDNRYYDHRTPEEKMEELRALVLSGKNAGALEKVKANIPVSYQDLGIDRLGTAKATLYGLCTHDFAMAPCMKQRDCMTCKEHVCLKGDHITLERIKLLEEQTSILLDKALKAQDAGLFGADRWTDHHRWKLSHVRTMRMVLEKDDIKDGTPVWIPPEHDPSPLKRVLRDQGMVFETDVSAIEASDDESEEIEALRRLMGF